MNSCRRLLSQGVANFLQRSPLCEVRHNTFNSQKLPHFIKRLLGDAGQVSLMSSAPFY
jgi:hypothetical protein